MRALGITKILEKRAWNLRAARCRTSGVLAQGITRILRKRAWNLRATRCRTSGCARTGEHNIFRDARTRDQDDFRDTRIREHDAFRDTRTRDQDAVRNTRTREHSDDRDARSRDLQFQLNERPTHEDDRGNSGDIQQNSYHSGNNSSMSRPSSSPKVPTFDGTNSAQFRPWIIQFEAIARHQGWTLGERVVHLVSLLTGPAANLLIGTTLGQLDDYSFFVSTLVTQI